jgi:hypothetical protein
MTYITKRVSKMSNGQIVFDQMVFGQNHLVKKHMANTEKQLVDQLTMDIAVSAKHYVGQMLIGKMVLEKKILSQTIM